MTEENKKDFEKDNGCPSFIAPAEEAIKDEDCKKCLIRTSCYYINSDEPKNKKNYWCNSVMSSYLKQLRAEVELQKKLQNQQEQKAVTTEVKDETAYGDALDLIDKITGHPARTPEEKRKYLEDVKKRKEELRKLEEKGREWQMHRREYLLEAEEKAKKDWEEKKNLEQQSADEKLHDLMHQETAEEIDRSASEETVFGYTREEFDRLYDKTHGFNVTFPDDGGPVSDMPFSEFIKQGAEELCEGAVETVITDENGRQRTVRKYGDWRDCL